jgi:hypothetical protein
VIEPASCAFLICCQSRKSQGCAMSPTGRMTPSEPAGKERFACPEKPNSAPDCILPIGNRSYALRIWQGNGGKGTKAKKRTRLRLSPPHAFASSLRFVTFCSIPPYVPVREETGVQFWQAPSPVLRCGEFRRPFFTSHFLPAPFDTRTGRGQR